MNRDIEKALILAERYLASAVKLADPSAPTRNELKEIGRKLSAIIDDLAVGRRQL